MGYRVLSTPRQSKGQSQYGRDVIAIKKIKGVSTLFLFERHCPEFCVNENRIQL